MAICTSKCSHFTGHLAASIRLDVGVVDIHLVTSTQVLDVVLSRVLLKKLGLWDVNGDGYRSCCHPTA